MKLKNEEAWKNFVKVNSNSGYGMAVVAFAERWADAMEEGLAKGAKVEDIAQACAERASEDDGITGYQFASAVSILGRSWEHGEELLSWHLARRT